MRILSVARRRTHVASDDDKACATAKRDKAHTLSDQRVQLGGAVRRHVEDRAPLTWQFHRACLAAWSAQL